mmetsp:Transcript_65200/g.180799  ORF Transcript_65200/g.180799 Transcript_65200/m.180799 type:complete len:233 (+) Transcript_65200:388-1086(+)
MSNTPREQRLKTALPPQADRGATTASTCCAHSAAPPRGSCASDTIEGARRKLARTHGKNVYPSSSAQARGLTSSSTSMGASAGAWAHGIRSSCVTRCDSRASAPPTASTPVPCRYASSMSSSSSSGNLATIARALHPASRRRRDARSNESGRFTVPHDAPEGVISSSTPSGTSVVSRPAMSIPSVARAASAACRWRSRSSSSMPASSTSPMRWLPVRTGARPQRPAAHSSSA